MEVATPVEILQTIARYLPIDANLRHVALACRLNWSSINNVAFARLHFKDHLEKRVESIDNVKWLDWPAFPPAHRALALTQRDLWLLDNRINPPVSPQLLGAAINLALQHAFIRPRHTASLLKWSSRRGALSSIEALLASGLDLTHLADPTAPNALTPALVLSSTHGHVEITCRLLQDPRIDPLACTFSGATFTLTANAHLIAAASTGHTDVLRVLLSDPRRHGSESEALFAAVTGGHLAAAQLLARDPRAQGSWNASASLRAASAMGAKVMVRLLIRETCADVDAKRQVGGKRHAFAGLLRPQLLLVDSAFWNAVRGGFIDVAGVVLVEKIRKRSQRIYEACECVRSLDFVGNGHRDKVAVHPVTK